MAHLPRPPRLLEYSGSVPAPEAVARLKQMDGAKASWALEQKKNNTDTPQDSDLFGATLYIRDKPGCPGGGAYVLSAVDTKVTCSLSTSGGHSY